MGSLSSVNKISLLVHLNGRKTKAEVYPMARLLDTLRECGALGIKEGCGEGECGACAVILDGKLLNSCLIPTGQVNGSSIFTVEGLASPKKLHKLQAAFVKYGGAQCGICTPGMLMAAYALLRKKKKPNKTEVKVALAGNLCRCTGYQKIFDSVRHATL